MIRQTGPLYRREDFFSQDRQEFQSRLGEASRGIDILIMTECEATRTLLASKLTCSFAQLTYTTLSYNFE
jgi:hypothetical protein